jgi:gliding motility-associated-like protein/uncharacterized repeat protein (TIGR01451 family)
VNSDITSIVYNGVAGGQVSLSGNVAGLSFVFTQGNTVLTISGRPTASGSFTVGTVGNDTETTTYIINVNQPPVLQPLNDVSVCEDKNAVFTVTSAEPGNTYKWQFNDNKGGGWQDFAANATGVSGSNTASVTLNNVPFTSNGKQLRVIVTSPLGCSTTSSIANLIVIKLPGRPVVLPSSNGFCVGTSVTLTYNPTAAVKTFQWYKDGVIIAGATQKTYQVSEKGSYHLVVKNIEGCESLPSDAIDIDVYPEQPQPEITIEGSTIFCAGESVKLTSSFPTGNQWYREGVPMAGKDKQILTVLEPGRYSVVVKNLNGCSAISEEIEVFVNPVPEKPSVSLTGLPTFCDGGSVTLTSSATEGNQWYKDGVAIEGEAGTGKEYIARVSGKYTVKVTLLTCAGPVSDGTTVVVNPIPEKPSVTLTGVPTFCDGGSVTLTSSSADGNQWYKDGVAIEGEAGTGKEYIARVSGKYTVKVTLLTCAGPVSDGTTVVVNPIPEKPSVSITGVPTFCDGGSVTLTSSAADGNQWYKDGVAIEGEAGTGTEYIARVSGKYTVKVTLLTCAGPVSDGTTVVVNPIPEKPSVSITGDPTFCDGGSVTLTSSAAAGNQWYKDGVAIEGEAGTGKEYIARVSGKYTVKVTLLTCAGPISDGTIVVVNPIPEKPSVSITGDPTFCDGGSVTLTSSAAAGNQWYKDGVAIEGEAGTGKEYIASVSGKYTVKVTLLTCAGPISDGTTVVVNPIPEKPSVSITGDPTFCDGGSVTLTSSAAAGNQWYKDGVAIEGEAGTGKEYIARVSGKYTVQVTLLDCVGPVSDGTTVVVNPIPEKPSVSISGDPTFCDGGSVTLTSSAETGNQWYKDGVAIEGEAGKGIEYVVRVSGKYTVQVTLLDCIGPVSDEKIITVNPVPEKPSVTITGVPTFCDGGSVTLTSSAETGNQWYKDGVAIEGEAGKGREYVARVSGKYTVQVTLLDCVGPVSDEKIITVNPVPEKPSVTITGVSTFCDGGSVTLTSSAETGNQWYKDGVAIEGGAGKGREYVARVSGKYTVKVTLLTCAGPVSDGTTVVVNPIPEKPSVSITGDPTFCDGGSVTLTSSSADGNQWYKDGVAIEGEAGTGKEYIARVSGKYTVKITLLTCAGLVSDGTIVVVNPIPEKPSVSITGVPTFCDGGSVTLTSSAETGNQWYKDGVTIEGEAGKGREYVVRVSGKYTVQVTLLECVGPVSDEKIITVNPVPEKPSVTITGVPTFCDGGSVTLTSSAETGNQWYKDGVAIEGEAGKGREYVVRVSGKYTVQVTLLDCVGPVSDEKIVTVSPVPEKPSVTITGDPTFCNGGTATLTSSAADGNQWYKDGVAIAGEAGKGIEYVVRVSGKYTVQVTLLDCIGPVSDEKIITVNPVPEKPSATITGVPTFCDGGSVTLTSSAETGNQWYKDGVAIEGEAGKGREYVVRSSGKYTVQVTLLDCVGPVSDEKNITVNPVPEKPSVTITGVPTFCDGGSVTLTSSAETGNQWYKDGVAIEGGAGKGREYVVRVSGKYTVQVTLLDCVGPVSDEKIITVNPVPEKPSVSITGDPTFCDGGSVTLTSSAADGNQWYKDGVAIEGEAGTRKEYIARVSGKYTVKVTLLTCVGPVSDGTTVVVNPIPEKPSVSITGDPTFCDGGSVTLTSSAADGNQWYKDGVAIEGEAGTGKEYIARVSGKYTVKVTLLTCAGPVSDGTTVVVNPIPEKPSVTITGVPTFCDGGSVTLTSSAADGNQWYKDGVAIEGEAGTGKEYIARVSGKYTVKVTLLTCAGPVSDGTTVVVNPIPEKPSVSITGVPTFCDGGSVTLTSSAADGNQWYKDGVAIEGEAGTGTEYIARVSGKYTVKVTLLTCAGPVSDGTIVVVNPIPEKPSVTITGDPTFCDGGSVTLTSSAETGNQWYKDGMAIEGEAETGKEYIARVSGKYTVKVTLLTCAGPVSDGTTVVVNPIPEKPSVTLTGVPTFCDGGSVTLTSSAADGNQWYKDGVAIEGEAGTGKEYIAGVSGKYTVKVTLLTCAGPVSDGTTVVVNPIPEKPSVTLTGVPTFCDGGSVTLTSSANEGNQWYKDGVAIEGEAGTGKEYIARVSGKYTVKVTLLTCAGPVSDGTTVVVNPIPEKPSVSITGDPTFCDGGSVTLTSSAETGNQWYKDGVAIEGEAGKGREYVVRSSGKYTVQVTLLDCVGPVSDEKIITVNPVPEKPSVTITGVPTFCDGGSVTLTSSAETGNQWYKDGVAIEGEAGKGREYVVRSSGKYTVQVTLLDCVGPVSDEKIITVNPVPEKPSVTITGVPTFCDGGSVTLTSLANDGNQWYKDGVAIAGEAGKGREYVVRSSGKYTVQVMLLDCVGPVSDEKIVTVNPIPVKPVVTITGETTFCDGGSVTLTSSANDGNQWYKDGVAIAGEAGTGKVYVARASGKYTVKVTLLTCAGPVSDEKIVTVNPIPVKPVVTITGETTFCDGGSVTLTSSANDGNQWYKDGVAIAGEAGTGKEYIARVSGKYTVKVTLLTCVGPVSDETTVTVNPIPVKPVVTITGETTFCDGGSVTLTSSATDGNQWYKDGVAIAGEAGTGKEYVARVSGKYTVKVTLLTCVGPVSDETTVTVNPIPVKPVVTITGETTFCDGGSVTLTSSATDGNQWYKDGVAIAGEAGTGKVYVARASGKYTVKVTLLTCAGPVSDETIVTVNPIPVKPVVTITGDPTFCDGGSVTLTSSANEGNQWYKDGVAIAGEAGTGKVYVVRVSGKYTVKVTSLTCAGPVSDETIVTVNPIPVKPVVTITGDPTFCDGGSVTLTSSANEGNQWYKDGVAIAGEAGTGKVYVVRVSGKYTVKVTLLTCAGPVSDETIVTANPIPVKPVVTISGETIFCDGGSVTLTSSANEGNQWYKDDVAIAGEAGTGKVYIARVGGKYTVKVTLLTCAGPLSDGTSVVVNPIPEKPSVTIAGEPIFCDGGSVTLTSSANEGNQWYKDGVAIEGAAGKGKEYVARVSGKYTVKVTLLTCAGPVSDETIVTVNPIPVKPVVTITGETTFCDGGSVTLTSSANEGNQWYKDGIAIAGEAGTGKVYIARVSGKYTVKVTLLTCAGPVSDETIVTVNPIPVKPVVTITGVPAFCDGGSVTLTSSANEGNQWYKDGIAIAGEAGTGKVYVARVGGKYTVKVTLLTCAGRVSDETIVTVNPIPVKPVVTITGVPAFCDGGSVTLTSSANEGNQWYKDGVAIAGEAGTGKVYVARVSGKYTVKVTLLTCAGPVSDETIVTVNPIPVKPVVTITGEPTFCDGGSVTLTSSANEGNQWYKDGIAIAGEAGTGKVYIARVSGKYTVKVTLLTCAGPVSNETIVTVNPIPVKPVVTTTGVPTFCDEGSVTLTSSANEGNQWYKDGVAIAGEAGTGKVYIARVSGKYTVKVTLLTCAGPVSDETIVTVNPIPVKPVVTITGVPTFCDGGSVTLTSSAENGNQWYKDGIAIAEEAGTGKVYIARVSGKYTVKVTLLTCAGPVSDETIVTVNPIPVKPVVTITGVPAFCDGGSVTLTSSANEGNQWYKDGVAIAGEAGAGKVYVARVGGKYTVKVTLLTCAGPVSDETIVTVNPIPVKPVVTITGVPAFCDGGSVTLTSSAENGNQWYKDGVAIAGESGTGKVYVARVSGKYTVKVTLLTCAGPVSDETIVTVNPIPVKPVVTITGETTFCNGGSVTLTSSANEGNQWYKDGVAIAGEAGKGKEYIARVSGKYTVKVTLLDCEGLLSQGVIVTVNPIPTIPAITAATPTSFCDGGSTILTSSSLTGNQWYKEGILIPGATSKTYTATESGKYTLIVTSAAGCTSPISLPITVTEVPYPTTPGISPSNTTTFCEGGIVTLTSSSSFGNQWYKNGVLIPGATNPTYDVNTIGVYTVKVTNTTGCTSPVSATTTVTVTPVPKGFDDQLNTLTCTQSSFNYQLQTNINNTLKGGNAVPSSFTWIVNSPVTGAVNGAGNSINATLINTGTTPQEVIYTVTPKALTGGCDGVPFKIKVSVPVCLGISITKTADRNYVSSVGDKINYTITVKNTGHANHNRVVVNDPLTGGILSNPTGDNGNQILEKDESWIYSTSYTLTQSDLDNNGAPSANIRKVQNVAMVQSAEMPIPSADVADVAIRQRPVIRLVKTGVLNNDYKTIDYTFLISNKGNVTLRDVELTDPKIPGLLISGPAVLAPGGWTTVTAKYTITEAEKKAGIVRNTATATGTYRPGDRVSDVSGTNQNNDDPTVIDVVRYPAAVDDFAKTKADIEVMVPVANNDRPSLFPLDVSTIDVKTQPLNGVLQMNRDGRIIYQPNKGYSGVEKFTYMINDENGLRSNIAVVTINVVPPDLEIPNTFTPNGDGKNDTFQIKGRENYDSIEISIFNRWGDEVYRSKNYKDEWDGAGLNEGTYFYVLKLKKGSHEESRRSWVLIKR